MDILNCILETMKTISTDYGNILLAAIAISALLYAKKEYKIKNRPFISCAIKAIQSLPPEGSIHFIATLLNSGNCPAHINIESIKLNIGDETHPTEIKRDFHIPVSGGLEFSVGHINKTGISNYKEGRYKKNRIEILLVLTAHSVYDKAIGSRMNSEFEISLVQDNPQIKIIGYDLKDI